MCEKYRYGQEEALFARFHQNNRFYGPLGRWAVGPLKFVLLQCYQARWIYNIDAVCTYSNRQMFKSSDKKFKIYGCDNLIPLTPPLLSTVGNAEIQVEFFQQRCSYTCEGARCAAKRVHGTWKFTAESATKV